MLMGSAAQKSQMLKKVGECLYRNGNKVYFALLKVRGKQIKRSLKTSDLPLAKRRLADLRAKSERLHGKENRNIRFDELAAQWLESIKSSLKPASLSRRHVAIVGLAQALKGIPVRTIGFAEIDKWKRGRGATLSARSHNIELETLKILLRYACQRGIVIDNHAEQFNRRKQIQATVVMPDRAQFTALVKELRNAPLTVASGAADMVEFLAYSGMRVGEAREVRFCDVNFDLGTVLITGGEGGTKNHQQRTLPLFPNLRNVIDRIKTRRQVNDFNARIFDILSPRGAMESACIRGGLPDFTVHSMRHFFASNAIEAGINFKVIADWLGHSDGGILVAKTYGHLRSEFSAAMAEKMSFDALAEPLQIRAKKSRRGCRPKGRGR